MFEARRVWKLLPHVAVIRGMRDAWEGETRVPIGGSCVIAELRTMIQDEPGFLKGMFNVVELRMEGEKNCHFIPYLKCKSFLGMLSRLVEQSFGEKKNQNSTLYVDHCARTSSPCWALFNALCNAAAVLTRMEFVRAWDGHEISTFKVGRVGWFACASTNGSTRSARKNSSARRCIISPASPLRADRTKMECEVSSFYILMSHHTRRYCMYESLFARRLGRGGRCLLLGWCCRRLFLISSLCSLRCKPLFRTLSHRIVR